MNAIPTQGMAPQDAAADEPVVASGGEFPDLIPAFWRTDEFLTRAMLRSFEEAKWVVAELAADHFAKTGQPLSTAERDRLFYAQGWAMRAEQ